MLDTSEENRVSLDDAMLDMSEESSIPLDESILDTFEENRVSLKEHISDLLIKAGPISVIYISNTLMFNLKRGLIAKHGIDALEAHIIARTIAELCTLPVPLLWSQAPVRVANLFGAIKANKVSTDISTPSRENEVILDDSNSYDENMDDSNSHVENLYIDIGVLIRQGYTFSILASIPVAIILESTKNPWISTFNNTESENTLASEYLLIYGMVILPEYINTMTEGFLSAVDQEKWIIPLRILSGAVDIGIAFWLIPTNPLSGDAYATLARNLTSVSLSILLLKFYPPLKKFNIVSFRWGKFNNMYKVLAESWPSSIYQLTQSGVTYLQSLLMGRLGSGRLATYQVPNALFEMASSLNFSLSEASNRIVAQYYGSHNFKETMRIGNISLIANTMIYSMSAFGINLLQYQLASLFLSESDIIEYGSMLRYNFIILAFVNLFRMLFDNSNKILSGVDDTIFSGFVWLFSSLALTLPLSAIVTYFTNLDMYGITAATGIGALASGLLGTLYWLKRSHGIIETENNFRSSNQVLSGLVKKIGFFSCCRKLEDRSSDIDQKEEQDLLVIEDSVTYSSVKGEAGINSTL